MAELLRFLYHLVGVQLDEELGQAGEDSDSDAAEDERNYRDFLIFETKKALLDQFSLQESRIFLNKREAIREGLEFQLQYFDEQLPELAQKAGCKSAPACHFAWIRRLAEILQMLKMSLYSPKPLKTQYIGATRELIAMPTTLSNMGNADNFKGHSFLRPHRHFPMQ